MHSDSTTESTEINKVVTASVVEETLSQNQASESSGSVAAARVDSDSSKKPLSTGKDTEKGKGQASAKPENGELQPTTGPTSDGDKTTTSGDTTPDSQSSSSTNEAATTQASSLPLHLGSTENPSVKENISAPNLNPKPQANKEEQSTSPTEAPPAQTYPASSAPLASSASSSPNEQSENKPSPEKNDTPVKAIDLSSSIEKEEDTQNSKSSEKIAPKTWQEIAKDISQATQAKKQSKSEPPRSETPPSLTETENSEEETQPLSPSDLKTKNNDHRTAALSPRDIPSSLTTRDKAEADKLDEEQTPTKPNRWRRLIKMVIIAFILAVIIKLGLHVWKLHQQKSQAEKAAAMATMQIQQIKSAHSALAIISAVNISDENNRAIINLKTNKSLTSSLQYDKKENVIALTLHHAQASKALVIPTLTKNSDHIIQDITIVGDKTENLTLAISVLPDTQVVNFSHDANQQQLTLALANLSNAANQKSAVIKQVPLTSTQAAEIAYEQALRLFQNYKPEEGIAALEKILQNTPGYEKARVSLASALISKNEYSQAQTVLEQGLTLSPTYAPFVQLQARILYQQGHLMQALKILESLSPSLQQWPDYYALMAAIEEQMGDHQAAAQLYQQLLTVEPNNSVWWMGLGIALDNLNQINAALNAYHRSLDTGKLTPAMQLFVMNKIKELQA